VARATRGGSRAADPSGGGHGERKDGAEFDEDDDDPQTSVDERHRVRVVRLGLVTRLAIPAGLVATAALVGAGAAIDAFDFEVRGLAGWIMGSDAKERYSIVALGADVPRASRDPTSPGSLTMAVVYFTYAVAVPCAVLPALLVLWLAPLSLRAQRLLYKLCEILHAWAALDVFMIAILACLTEISQFAQFMVGDKCDGINKFLKKHLDDELHGDDKCFDVVTQLNKGAWLLFVASLASGALAHLVLRLAHAAIRDREDHAHSARERLGAAAPGAQPQLQLGPPSDAGGRAEAPPRDPYGD